MVKSGLANGLLSGRSFWGLRNSHHFYPYRFYSDTLGEEIKTSPTEPPYVLPLLLLTMVLNVVDWAFTQVALANGSAVELNPLVATLFSHSPLAALLWKVFIVGVCCVLLFVYRFHRPVYVTIWVVAVWFVLLTGYQIIGRALLT